MKKTSLITAILKAFYSRKFYREVFVSWQQRSFFYLLVFSLIIWIPATLVLSHNIEGFFLNIAHQFPTISIKGGVATSNLAGPTIIRDHKTNKVLAVVDVNNQYKNFQKDSAILLVSKTGYSYKTGKNDTVQFTKFSKTGESVLTSQAIVKRIDRMLIKVTIVAYLLGVVLTYLAGLIWGLLFGVLVFILCRIRQLEMPFMGCFGAGLMVLTPGLTLFFVLLWFDVLFSTEWILILLVQLVYLVWAVYTLPVAKLPK